MLRTLGSALVVAVVLGGTVAALASLGTTNELLISSPWRTPAVLTLVVVVVTVAGLILGGHPGRRHKTPYW